MAAVVMVLTRHRAGESEPRRKLVPELCSVDFVRLGALIVVAFPAYPFVEQPTSFLNPAAGVSVIRSSPPCWGEAPGPTLQIPVESRAIWARFCIDGVDPLGTNQRKEGSSLHKAKRTRPIRGRGLPKWIPPRGLECQRRASSSQPGDSSAMGMLRRFFLCCRCHIASLALRISLS